MTPTLVAVLLQASSWIVSPQVVTVGDTVHLTRQFTATPDVRARLEALQSTPELEALAPPRWSYAEGELTVVYTIALFAPGRRGIPMPDVELVGGSGVVETVMGDTAWVVVESVLPTSRADVSPMPSQGPISRQRKDALPVIGLVALTFVAVMAWGALRLRRESVPASEPRAEGPAVEPPIDIWVASGESRAVATVVSGRLRDVLASQIPEAGRHLHTDECIRVLLERDRSPLTRRIADVLRALERARFSPAAPGDVLEVVDAAETVMGELQGNSLEPEA